MDIKTTDKTNKVFRFLGKKGRTTVPEPIRIRLGLRPGDLLSFEVHPDGSLTLRKEKVCNKYPETEHRNTSQKDRQRGIKIQRKG